MKFDPQASIKAETAAKIVDDYIIVPTCCGAIVVRCDESESAHSRSGDQMDDKIPSKTAEINSQADSTSRPAIQFHAVEAAQALTELSVDKNTGLSSDEVERRRHQHGWNELRRTKSAGILTLIARQFISPVVWLLMVAAIISAVLGEFSDMTAIIAVLLINTAIGFATEYKAQKSMDAIRILGRTHTSALRNATKVTLESRELVPGDIVFLSAGNIVPADIRLVDMTSLQVSESALTGESMPVEKQVAPVDPSAPLGERASMLFKGTSLTRGDCIGVVTHTGMKTQVGHITELMMGTADAPSPLEKQLQALGGQLMWLTVVLCALVATIGMLSGRDLVVMIHSGIALAVAAIPEGLPIVATVALAGGMWRMAQRNALVERMAAVETLGSTTVIFTDKTGTLTENRLIASEIRLPSGLVALTGKSKSSNEPDTSMMALLQTGALCNHAKLEKDGPGTGDPLEIALLQAASDRGIDIQALQTKWQRVGEQPFDSTSKLMASAHKSAGAGRIYCKGAPERLIAMAKFTLQEDGSESPLTAAERTQWTKHAEQMAASGLRVLALAQATFDDQVPSLKEPKNLALQGLVGFRDPPRPRVPAAIKACQEAGIRVIMVTGDHLETATAIAGQVGIPKTAQHGIDGQRLDQLLQCPGEAPGEIHNANVFARVTPEHKLRLVERMQAAGEIVAMTGDGVNDAPALRQADIGVAMGQRGTDVAREAADVVLLDDSFPTIVAAVSYGRLIFDNIRRFVVYLLSCNLSEILVVATAIILGLPLALLPLQILFLNLVTDVFPAFALAAGKGDPDILSRPPRPPSEKLLGQEQWANIVRYGLTITAVTLVALLVAVRGMGLSATEATTISFLTIAFAQLFHIFNMRSAQSRLLDNDVTRNPWVWSSLALCTALLLAAVYIPPVASVLVLTPPSSTGWFLILGLATLPPLLDRASQYFHWTAIQTSKPDWR